MKIQNAIILYSLLLGLPVGGWAQTETDSTALERRVRPIESPRLQGTREPSEEEKAYARLLAEEREEQAQLRRDYIDSVKANLKSQLDSLYVLDEKSGKKTNIIDFERERAAKAGGKKEKK